MSLSAWVIPLFLLGILVHGLVKKVDVYAAFVEGAKKGLATALKIMPYVVTMLFAVEVFTASGCLAWLAGVLAPLLSLLALPPELLPLFLMRPFSGSGGLGLLAGIILLFALMLVLAVV